MLSPNNDSQQDLRLAMELVQCFISLLYHVIPCCTMLYHVIPCYTVLYHVIPCYTMLYHVVPCYTMLYHVIPCCTMLYHVVPCCTMLYHVIPVPCHISCDSMWGPPVILEACWFIKPMKTIVIGIINHMTI